MRQYIITGSWRPAAASPWTSLGAHPVAGCAWHPPTHVLMRAQAQAFMLHAKVASSSQVNSTNRRQFVCSKIWKTTGGGNLKFAPLLTCEESLGGTRVETQKDSDSHVVKYHLTWPKTKKKGGGRVHSLETARNTPTFFPYKTSKWA